jgi:hypothetical protein
LHQPVKDLILGSIQLRAVRQSAAVYCHRWVAKAG